MGTLLLLFFLAGLLAASLRGGLFVLRRLVSGLHPAHGMWLVLATLQRLTGLHILVFVQYATDPVSLHNRSHRHTLVSTRETRKFVCSIRAIFLKPCRLGENTRYSITEVHGWGKVDSQKASALL